MQKKTAGNSTRGYLLPARSSSRGVTLIDTIVGSALMLVIFLGIGAAFQLSVDVVLSNKARAGAIALANERMEYVRSLGYAAVGTAGGIPAGAIPQSETVTLNGVTFTRRTLVVYADDPKDGLGAADSNAIIADYKAVKVDVSWVSRTGVRHITLVSRVSPTLGMESNPCGSPCGTLTINVVDSQSAPLPNATVTVVNASTSVNLTTYTNVSGTAQLIGTPASAGYQVTVTKPGYSTAQTYTATAQNTNPNPGNLTVSGNQTTSATFAIDVLGTKVVRTYTMITGATTTDSFSDVSGVATSSNIDITGGAARLAADATWGEVQSVSIAPSYIAKWRTLAWSGTQPAGTSVLYRVYDVNGASLIPDSQLPGNSAGFTAPYVDLTGISTSTYAGLRIDATLTSTGPSSPTIDSWSIGYDYGPVPLPNLAFTLTGAKTAGTGPGGAVYKYSAAHTSGAPALVTVANLEWDAYTITVNGTTTGYDIASACGPQPEALAPGASVTTALYFASHTVNSLLADVRSAATGALVPDASVRLYKTGYDTTLASDACGQAFFAGLASGTYSISVSAPGYAVYTNASVSVGGASRLSVTLN